MSGHVAASTGGNVSHRAVGRASPIDRGRLFAGLTLIGFLNGISHHVIDALHKDVGDALLNTFDISAVVWLSLAGSIYLFLRSNGQAASRKDLIAAGLVLVTFLVPAPPLSWMGLSGLAVYIIVTSPAGSCYRRSAWVLLALTVPTFWSRLLFLMMSDLILRVDAILVSLILGTSRNGNAVAFADGWGYFWIAPACSSLTNIALAFPCWILVTQLLNRDWSDGLRYFLLAAGAVTTLNIGRLVAIGISHPNYEVIHSPVGNLVLGWFFFAVTLAICFYGATRGAKRATSAAH
jgi:exosortase/archaeosortase family protein